MPAKKPDTPNYDIPFIKRTEARARAGASPLSFAYTPIILIFADEDRPTYDGYRQAFTRKDFGSFLTRRIDESFTRRRTDGFDDTIRDYRDQYDGKVPPKSFPFEGCSNYNVPLSGPAADALHAQILGALFSGDPWLKADAPDAEALQFAGDVEQSMHYILKNVVGLKALFDEVTLRAIVDRGAITRTGWEILIDKERTREEVTPALRAELEALGLSWQLNRFNDGDIAPITREKILHEKPVVEIIDILNFVTYPVDAAKASEVRIWCHRYGGTRSYLYSQVKSGNFDEASVKELCESSSNYDPRDEEKGGERSRYEDRGIPSTDTILDSWEKPYEIVQGLLRLDVDNDGIDEWVLFDVSMERSIVLRAEVYPYDHNEPFYEIISPYIMPGSLYPPSAMEKVEDTQAEVNAISNSRQDRANLEITAPIIAHNSLRRDMEGKEQTIGGLYFADNPRDAYVPTTFANGSQRSLEEVEFALAHGNKVLGVNETTQGITEGESTVGAIERAMQGASKKFDINIERMARAVQNIARQIFRLYAQYGPELINFIVEEEPQEVAPGEPAQPVLRFDAIEREKYRNGFSFTLHGSQALANPVLQLQIAEKGLMLSERSPFMMSNLTRQWEAEKAWWMAAGRRDYARFIGTKRQAAEQQKAQESAPPPPPEMKISVTRQEDEVFSLAAEFAGPGVPVTPEMYLQAAAVAAVAAEILSPPDVPGADKGDATDNSAGYEKPETDNAEPTNDARALPPAQPESPAASTPAEGMM